MSSCLGCNALESPEALVTLVDGRTVCRSCDDWRQECEARAFLKMPELERNAALQDRVKKRGVDSVNELRRLMAAIFRAERRK